MPYVDNKGYIVTYANEDPDKILSFIAENSDVLKYRPKVAKVGNYKLVRQPHQRFNESYGQMMMRMAANKQYYQDSRERWEADQRRKARQAYERKVAQDKRAKELAKQRELAKKRMDSFVEKKQKPWGPPAYRLKSYMTNIKRIYDASGFEGSLPEYVQQQGYHIPTYDTDFSDKSFKKYMTAQNLPIRTSFRGPGKYYYNTR